MKTYHLYIDKINLMPLKVWSNRRPVFNQKRHWDVQIWNDHSESWYAPPDFKITGRDLLKLNYVGKFEAR